MTNADIAGVDWILRTLFRAVKRSATETDTETEMMRMTRQC